MNNLFRGLISGYGAYKLGGGGLGTVRFLNVTEVAKLYQGGPRPTLSRGQAFRGGDRGIEGNLVYAPKGTRGLRWGPGLRRDDTSPRGRQ